MLSTITLFIQKPFKHQTEMREKKHSLNAKIKFTKIGSGESFSSLTDSGSDSESGSGSGSGTHTGAFSTGFGSFLAIILPAIEVFTSCR